jgi:DNA-directed RNA polymerase subunit H (RpoH/RPB5)
MAVVCISKGNVDVVREVLREIAEGMKQVVMVVLVSRCELTSFTRKDINAKRNPTVDFFHLKDLQRCILDHKLVPRHVPLTPEETARVRSTYRNAVFNNIPVRDPVVRFLGCPVGQVLFVWETFGRRAPQPAFFEVVGTT